MKPEYAGVRDAERLRNALWVANETCRVKENVIKMLERQNQQRTKERDELAERVGHLKNAYHAQELELDLERSHSRILSERFDALRSQLPDAGSKVERFKQAQMRGERTCL